MQNETIEFEHQEEQIHLRDYLIVLLARKWLVILGFFAVLLAAIYYIQTTEPVYKATEELLYEEQIPLLVEPFPFASTSLELEAQRRIVKSPFVIGPAIDSLRAVIPNFNLTSKALEGSIELDSPPGSAILELSAIAGSPVDAALIANTVADSYIKYTTERKREDLTLSLNFLEEQKKVIEGMLEDDERELNQFRTSEGLAPGTSATSKASSSLLDQLWQYNEDLVKTQWEKEMTRVRLNSVKELLAEKREEIDPETQAYLLAGGVTSEIGRLKDKILDLQLELESKLEVDGMTEKHEEVKGVRQRLTSAQRRLEEEAQKLVKQEKMGSLNPISEWQDLMQQSTDLTIALKGLEEKEKLIQEKIDRFNEEHPKLVSKEVQLRKLERQKKIHEETAIYLATIYQETQLLFQMQTSDIAIIRKASPPGAPIKPKKKLTMVLAVLLGLMLGVGAAFFLEYMDDSIKRKEDIDRYIGAPVIGAIPRIPKAENFDLPIHIERRRHGAMVMFDNPNPDTSEVSETGEDGENALIIAANNQSHSNNRGRKHRRRSQVKEIKELASRNLTLLQKDNKEIAESYRGLLANIEYSSVDEEPPKTLLITSSTPKEGKTTTTANLAITMAQMGKKTLLIDCDMKKPRQHAVFMQARAPGLSDYLLSKSEVQAYASDGLSPSLGNGFIRETGVENLHLLPCGKLPPNSMAIVGSEKMEELIDRWKEDGYDYILFDSPPVLAVADAGILSAKVNATLLIVKTGSTKQKIAQLAAERLSKAGNLFGVVLNNMDVSKRYGYYYYYYPDKYYSADDDEQA